MSRKRDTLQLAQMQCVRCDSMTVVPLEEAIDVRLECPRCFGRLRLKIVRTDRRQAETAVAFDRRG